MKPGRRQLTRCKSCNGSGSVMQPFFDGTEKTLHSKKCGCCFGKGFLTPRDRVIHARIEAKRRSA